MRWIRSLRAQLALGAGVLALVVVASAGLVITIGLDAQDRAAVDSELAERAARIQADVPKMLLETNGTRPGDRSSGDDYGGLLDNSGSLVRLISGSTVLVERGDIPAVTIPPAPSPGLATISIEGDPWRSLVVDAAAGGGVRLEVLQDLGPIVERLDANRRLVAVVTLAATLAAAVGGWLVASVVTRPLRQLRDVAREIRATGVGPERLPMPDTPLEVHDLAATLNAMLLQLETSMATTRRFTADAGHELRSPLTSLGAYLETLEANPQLEPVRVAPMVDAMLVEHRRITALLDGLQALARGDAGAIPSFVSVDLGDLTQEAVREARRRHPTVAIDLHDTTDGAAVAGWPDGLRLAVDNLLDNAALHGRTNGHIVVRLDESDARVIIDVADDGPGIAVELRQRVIERFARGPETRSAGTGLGLSLVSQQAAIHGGSLDLDQATSGGLLARLSLPRATPSRDLRQTSFA